MVGFKNMNINISPLIIEDYSSMSFGQLKYTDNIYDDFIHHPLGMNIGNECGDNACEHNYCRLCAHLVSVSCLSPLNTSKDGITFIDKIKFCFGEKVLIQANDGLPQEICDSCVVNLNNFNKILQSYIKAGEELRKLYKKPETAVKKNNAVVASPEPVLHATEILDSTPNKIKNYKSSILYQSLTVSKPVYTYSRKNQAIYSEENVGKKSDVHLISNEKNDSSITDCDSNVAPLHPEVSFDKNSTEPVNVSSNVVASDKTPVLDNNSKKSGSGNVDGPKLVGIIYECLICHNKFESKENVAQHYIAEHPIPAEKKILCKVIKTHKNATIRKPEMVVPTLVNTAEKNSSPDKVYYGISYQCLICSLVFQRKSAFLKHSLQRHQTVGKNRAPCKIVKTKITKNGRLSCTECNAFFSNYKLYRKHMRKHGLYKCDNCDQTFDKIQSLKEHSKIHKPCDAYFCSLCPKVFASRKDLINHGAMHYKDKVPDADVDNEYFKSGKYRCTTCFELFDSAISVRKHHRVHESCLCNQCGKLFSSLNYLQRHIKTHTDARPFSCNICLKSFKTMPNLKKHRRTHDEERNFICQHCGKLFRTMQVLRQHVLTHTAQKSHPCDICGVQFRRRSNMIVHRNRHASLDPSAEQCKECGRKFSSLKALRCHLVQHLRPGAPFECGICKKRFMTQRQCEKHERGHSDEKPYPCEVCSKRFRSAATLRQHKVIHENVFPYECSFCDRKFRRLQSLLVHKKTHTGERPHDCPECGRAFANRGDMIKHRRIHMRSHAMTTKTIDTNDYIESSVPVNETIISEPPAFTINIPMI